jgi:ribosomal protein S18 acetylase RimI-like enzyme
MNVELRALTKEDLTQVYGCFVKAFSGDDRTIVISERDFYQRLNRNAYLPQISVGAFMGEEMVGFMLHCLSQTTAYNAGTGVVPAYRGQQLGQKMFAFALPLLRQQAQECLLEVLKTNAAALKTYQNCGFTVKRELMLYALYSKNLKVSSPKTRFHIIEAEQPDWSVYQNFGSFSPSYQNRFEAIARDWDDQKLLEAYHKADLVGYCIFSMKTGRISQLAVSETFRRKGIGSALLAKVYYLSKVKEISILNVDAAAGSILEFFKKTGFVRPLIQLEMSRTLTEPAT